VYQTETGIAVRVFETTTPLKLLVLLSHSLLPLKNYVIFNIYKIPFNYNHVNKTRYKKMFTWWIKDKAPPVSAFLDE